MRDKDESAFTAPSYQAGSLPQQPDDHGSAAAINLCDFFVDAGLRFEIFDLGRRITPLSAETLLACEKQQQVYPYPFKKCAHLAILFWPPELPDQSVIWFIALPIDELGYLSIQARDDFIREVLSHVGKNIGAQLADSDMQDVMKSNAYAFKPAQDKLAMYHAHSRALLGFPRTRYFDVVDNFVQKKAAVTWHELGVQGVAEYCLSVRDDEERASWLSEALMTMDAVPRIQFLMYLEGGQYQGPLLDTLRQCLTDAQQLGDDAQLVASMRALSCCRLSEVDEQLLAQTLDASSPVAIEVLATFAGRLWERLDAQLMPVFLEALALHEPLAFKALTTDLMHMPQVRRYVLAVKNDHDVSAQLAKQFESMLAHLH